jgi:L-ribulose-5-phosphate 4-epimerase
MERSGYCRAGIRRHGKGDVMSQQDPFWFEREELVGAMRWLDSNRDVVQDTHGNLSMRVGTSEDFSMLIKPSGVPYSELEPWMVPAVSVDGTYELRGDVKKPSVDTQHHLSIYKKYSHVRAICHTHSPYATAFAIAGSAIPCSSTEQADYFGGHISCLPYFDLNGWGDKVVVEIGTKAVLLEKHGVLTFGTTPLEAVELAVAVENVAKKTAIAIGIAGVFSQIIGVRSLPKEEIDKWHKRYTTGYGQ